MEPDIVFFGLIFVNFGPFNDLPKIKPPRSDKIEINNEYIIKIFKSGLFDSTYKIKRVNKKRYDKNIPL